MNTRYLILLISCLLFSVLAKAQETTASLKGSITDVTGKPLASVAVHLLSTKHGVRTNEQGRFELKGIPAGEYKLRISMMDYDRIDTLIRLKAGQELIINKVLRTGNGLEVVVSGTMKETYLTESPVHVEIITDKFLKKNPTPSLFEALANVNGVRPQINCNVCNTGDIHINGMEGAYTMITIDGMPIVSALSTVYGLSGLPTSMIQRIEIIKGPASTLYGSEAVGGLINVITKNPWQAPAVSVDVFSTSQWEKNVDFGFRSKIGKATGLISGNYFHFNNRLDINHDNFTDMALQNRMSVFGKWALERKNNRLASLAARYVYEDRWGGEMNWEKMFRGTDSVYGESIYTRRAELIGTYQLPTDAQRLLLSYSFNIHNQNSYYGTTPFMADQRIGFAQLVWDKKIGSRHDALFGAALRYVYHDDNSVATQTADTLNPMNQPAITWLPGIFAQDEMKLNSKTNLLMGLRFDHNSLHGPVLSPRMNMKWTPDQKNTVRLGIGNGYRVVNVFSEDHAAFSGARQIVLAEKLQPERSWNANLNYVRMIDLKKGYLNLDGSLFYTYFFNKIVADYFTDDNKIIYANLRGHGVSRGLTINADATFNFPLKITAGFTLMDVFQMEADAEDKMTRQRQMHSPNFTGSYTVSYTLARQRLRIDYTGNITSPMRMPILVNDYRPEYSPWFSIQNLQVTRTWDKGWEIYGGIKNLLNYRPLDPIMRPFDPFDKQVNSGNPNGYTFDPGYNYAPMQGMRMFLGVRYNLN